MRSEFYNARRARPAVLTRVARPTLQGHAGSNYLWISAPNASGRYQLWPSVIVQPDGQIAATAQQHRTSMILHDIDTRTPFYDACGPWTKLALQGKLNTGKLVTDSRSRNRSTL